MTEKTSKDSDLAQAVIVPRYTVYWSNGRRDGEACFASLADAESKFASACEQADAAVVEIIDNADLQNPVVLQRWNSNTRR